MLLILDVVLLVDIKIFNQIENRRVFSITWKAVEV